MTEDNKRNSRSEDSVMLSSAPKEEVEQWLNLSEMAAAGSHDLTSPEEQDNEETSSFQSLRPTAFNQYIGQEAAKDNLRIACKAAQKRGEALDHVLLHGPPGLGKTSMAKIIARELNVGFRSTSGPVIEKPGDLAAILTSLQPQEVLFIDEIHRLPRVVEEVLYPAMEDFEIDILIGQGPSAKSVKIDLKPFTLVGATTRTGQLTSPLRDRFGIVQRLEFYTPEELAEIVSRSAKILALELDHGAAAEIGARARGTPRIANRLLKRVRDFSDESNFLSLETVRKALMALKVDQAGLDQMDRLILETIISKFDGGPVGIETIAAAVGEEKITLEDMYEPYLVQKGFLMRTKRGRTVAPLGYMHLGLAVPLDTSVPEDKAVKQSSLVEDI